MSEQPRVWKPFCECQSEGLRGSKIAMKRILVVDDSEGERKACCRLIERAGFEVQEAMDGEEGLEKLQRDRFDLLLVDVWMPRMNGLELLSRLPEESRPKALVITGDTNTETVLQSVRENAYLLLSKPVNPQDLIQSIRTALESPSAGGEIQVLSAQPDWVQLRFPCEMRTAGRVENVVEQLSFGLPLHMRHSVGLAFHELLMNAIEWGGRLNPNFEVRIDYLRTQRFLTLRIADPGKGFQVATLRHAATAEEPLAHIDVRERRGIRPGGYGIQLAKSLVDELIYNEARNEVVMVKYFN
jgi:two-component system, OmpR family, response regulator